MVTFLEDIHICYFFVHHCTPWVKQTEQMVLEYPLWIWKLWLREVISDKVMQLANQKNLKGMAQYSFNGGKVIFLMYHTSCLSNPLYALSVIFKNPLIVLSTFMKFFQQLGIHSTQVVQIGRFTTYR